MPSDERILVQAEGYLELGLPRSAMESLSAISDAGQAEHPYPYHYLMADSLRQCKEFELAIRHFESARRERPAETASYFGKSWCFKRIGRLDDAIDSLIEAERVCQMASLQDEWTLVHYNLSCYYSLAGRKREMLDRLGKALERDKKYLAGISSEPDFDPYRDDPEFVRLVSMHSVV